MKKVLYVSFLGWVFLVSMYLTFPIDSFRFLLEEQILHALSGEQQGTRFQTPPQVMVGELSLWRLSGIAMQDVQIRMASETEESGAEFKLAKLKIRLGILSTLLGKPKIHFDSKIDDGSAAGSVTLKAEGALSALSLNIRGIDLAKLRGPVNAETDLKMNGLLNLNADLNLGKNPVKDGDGQANIDFKNLSIGPGVFELPGGALGGFTLPKIVLGRFAGKISLQHGKAHITDLNLSGGDLEARVNANVELVENILLSPLKGSGWFKLKPDFQKANPKIASVLEMSPDIKAAEEADGRVHFTLIGSLMQPTPKWGKE
ncbi:MAG: type II secretion system protein GspN [Myxococcaceae bacterium]|nr:type II secretion system protein GspN [Myxococcaceae bacterium]MBH2006479.1 type II secretion system protein GspN [Myxococcaceae bacterium]